MLNAESPIGLFDSGVGGLTVATAIRAILPSENMVYYGDTAHLPYGDKSRESIIGYSLGISDFLLEKDCKIILIACNSASSNAYEEVKAHVGDKALVLNVIDPVVENLVFDEDITHLGIIGTKATINSNTYPDKIKEFKPGLKVSSLATALLVPMIEEGFVSDDVSDSIVRSYLSNRELNGIDSLILGCTHYPIIKNQINRFYNFEVHVIDSARIVAEELKRKLIENNLLNPGNSHGHEFYVSDHSDYFNVIAKMFFGENIELKKVNIWE